MFGGIYTIGFTGLVVGLIVLEVFAATLTAFEEDDDAMTSDTPPPEPLDGDSPAPWLDEAADDREQQASTEK